MNDLKTSMKEFVKVKNYIYMDWEWINLRGKYIMNIEQSKKKKYVKHAQNVSYDSKNL